MTSRPAQRENAGACSNRWAVPVLLLLLALGLAMRVWGAWVYEYAITSDHGVICLMVKHMLQGAGIPVFYYGQSYMGAIEPAVSAALCAMFGLTGFWINMGTALVAFAFLPLVWLWGRGAAGHAGGLAALAFCVIGPPQYFQFESWAYGGYAAIPLFTCLVLILSLRLLAREAGGERVSHGRFLVLGAAAGLGWWQSPLLIPAFITSAILFVVVMRQRVFTLRLFSGAAGFLLGSLPLWLWNWHNRWQTFDMVKTRDSPSLGEGLKLFYLVRLPDLLEFSRHPPLIRIALAALVLLLAALALARLIEVLRARSREQALYLGAAVLFLVVFSILFGRSRFARVNALRYVLLTIPVLGVLAGAATAWLTARTRWVLGGLPLAALVALQAVELPKRPPERRETAAFMPKVEAFGAFLRQHGIRQIYTDYQVRRGNYGLNFLLREEFVFSPQTRDRYRPYAVAMELADQPAVLNNSLGFRAFLTATRSQAASGGMEGLNVQYAAQPPPEIGRAIPASEWAAVGAPGAADARAALTDADARTRWRGPVGNDQEAVLDIRFKEPKRVSGVRLMCGVPGYPAAFAVEGWRESEPHWTALLPITPATRYFWSGPRFYWGGDLFRLEGRFAPLLTDRIRLRVKRPERGDRCDLQEVQVFEEPDGDGIPADSAALVRLVQTVRERGLKRLYADRWEANALFQACGDLLLPISGNVFEREALKPEMTLDERTGILVREREAELSRRALAERMVRFRETAVGPWLLIDFPAAGALPPHARSPGLRWAGVGCLREGDLAWALAAEKSVREWMEDKAYGEAVPLAERALKLQPFCRPLAEALAGCYAALGNAEKAAAWKASADKLWVPDVPVPARFEGGIELLGIGLNQRLAPGTTIPMKLYWRVAAAAETDGLAVFVHFTRDHKALFQDNHPLLDGMLTGLPGDRQEVWVEERLVAVPAGVPPGELRMEIGLYRPEGKGRRLPVKSEFRGRRNVVIVPASWTALSEPALP